MDSVGALKLIQKKEAIPIVPSLTAITPASSAVNPTPPFIIATFTTAMTPLLGTNFALSGTCLVLPTAGTVTMSGDGLTATLALSGGTCLDTQTLVVSLDPTATKSKAGIAGAGAVVVNTYTVDTSGPSAVLAPPSSLFLNTAGTSTLALTYTASAVGGTTLTGALTAAGGGVTLTTVTGTPSCTVAVDLLTTPSNPVLTLGQCSGEGALTVHVDAATAVDSLGNRSIVSSESEVITIDNTAPTLLSITPSTSSVNPIPARVVVTFSEAMQALSLSNFTLANTCTSLLSTKDAVLMSDDQTTATLFLSEGTCSHGETLTVSVDPSLVLDLAGNAGSGAVGTNTYTVDTISPSASLGTPSVTLLNSAGTSTLTLLYTAGTVLTTGSEALSSIGGGVTLTGSPTCTVAVTGITVAGATITLSQCSGNGTLTVHVNEGTVKDDVGNPSTVSSESAVITVDNTPPTVVSVSPPGGTIKTNSLLNQQTFVVTFSKPVEALVSLLDNFTLVNGTCTGLGFSSILSIFPVGGQATQFTVTTNASCGVVGQNFRFQTLLTGFRDAAGNVGVGTNTTPLLVYRNKRIFVSSTSASGALGGSPGGIAGADAICQADANNPDVGTSYSANYKALLVDGTTRRACTSANCVTSSTAEHLDWVLTTSTSYVRGVDSTTTIGTTNVKGLLGFPLSQSISPSLALPSVWTGLGTDWTTSSNTCGGWANGVSGLGVLGSFISTTSTDPINYSNDSCALPYPLYCVEQ